MSSQTDETVCSTYAFAAAAHERKRHGIQEVGRTDRSPQAHHVPVVLICFVVVAVRFPAHVRRGRLLQLDAGRSGRGRSDDRFTRRTWAFVVVYQMSGYDTSREIPIYKKYVKNSTELESAIKLIRRQNIQGEYLACTNMLTVGSRGQSKHFFPLPFFLNCSY